MPAGRPPNPIEYTDVPFTNGQTYTVGKVKFKDSYIYFVIDVEDKEKVQIKNWHVVTGAYIGCYYHHEGKKKTLYLHNFLLDRRQFEGKGQTTTIDHINGIGYDNRRCNLREVNQSLQNMNTKDRARTSTRFPEGFDSSQIPRNIWYIPPSGSHGERFAVEFKGIPGVEDILWKTTSSKLVTTRVKLDLAILKKEEILQMYPQIVEHSRASDASHVLKEEYTQLVTTLS